MLDAFTDRKSEEHFTRLVPSAEIAENGYNVLVSSYVAKEDKNEVIDITELNAKIAQIVTRQSALRTQIDAIVADLEGSRA